MSIALHVVTEHRGLVSNAAEQFKFPGGEVHIRNVKDLTGTWIADVRGASVEDLATAAMLADVAHERSNPLVLMLPYLPAARADRGTPNGAWTYSNFVNQVYAQQVIGIDPHSEVITHYINNLTVLEPLPLLQLALDQRKVTYDGVIAPDAGALGRSGVVAEALGVDLYQAEKHRDFDTGKILSIKMTEQLPTGRYLVADDICDGGGTFMGLAGATGLSCEFLDLWITHGIFSGGATALRYSYGNIFTSDSHPGYNRVGVATSLIPTFVYMLQNLKDF